jgi:putative phosphoribosyl transferase
MTKFPDLSAGGRALAEAAALREYRRASDTIVIAIATAGVPVAVEVARTLHLPLDLLIVRRLRVPLAPELPLCAVSVAGAIVIDERVGPMADELDQLVQRQRAFRGERSPIDLAGKHVVLVDNGIHTGGTMLIAIRALRRVRAGSIVVAAPVGNAEVRSSIEHEADRVVCLFWHENFGHVGMWYRQVVRPAEPEIRTAFERSYDKVSADE